MAQPQKSVMARAAPRQGSAEAAKTSVPITKGTMATMPKNRLSHGVSADSVRVKVASPGV